MTDLARLEAVVHGRVQGVGFRYYTLRVASGLRLEGWVANESSGRVRVVAEGPVEDLRQLLVALREGPPGALVEHVDDTWPPLAGNLGVFAIRPGWHAGD
jgi:acylphosphatase